MISYSNPMFTTVEEINLAVRKLIRRTDQVVSINMGTARLDFQDRYMSRQKLIPRLVH
jgi:hypothetical protein